MSPLSMNQTPIHWACLSTNFDQHRRASMLRCLSGALSSFDLNLSAIYPLPALAALAFAPTFASNRRFCLLGMLPVEFAALNAQWRA